MKRTLDLTVHYYRYAHDYTGWSLWLWTPGDKPVPVEIFPCDTNHFGLTFVIPAAVLKNRPAVGFLPKFKNWSAKDTPDRILTDCSASSVYILQGDRDLYFSEPPRIPRIRSAFVDSSTEIWITLNTSAPLSTVSPETLSLTANGTPVPVSRIITADANGDDSLSFNVIPESPLDPESARTGLVRIGLLDTSAVTAMPRYIFDDPCFYFDDWLGCRYTGSNTTFRVWAPAANSLDLVLSKTVPLPSYGSAGPDQKIPMEYQGKGLWSLSLPGNFEHWYYRLYSMLAHDPGVPVPVYDPYARAIDRKHFACVITFDATAVSAGPSFAIGDAIIYEMHIRDFSRDDSSGIRQKGCFPGLHQPGTRCTRNNKIKTGLDHLQELGVNTLQLMPVHAFMIDKKEGEYQWGYMPEHFNAPEPSYASDGNGVTAVTELKTAIDRLHQAGFKIILDVVYNHTSEGPSHIRHFNGLVPDYFYRVKPDGSYWNGSGCGNEFRTEGPMAAKFILDSLEYWVSAYNVDGFRFDLMGLLDLSLMKRIISRLTTLKEFIFIYGEPWSGGDTPIAITSKGSQKDLGFSCFNDSYRVAISGGVFDPSPGFVSDGRMVDDIISGWKGSFDWFTGNATESINYVECHDDRTFRDKLSLSTFNAFPQLPAESILAMDRLGAFLVILAQGVPFLQIGQDFFRTKFGVHNTYNKGDDYNTICWYLKQEYFRLFEYYRGLITIRNHHPIFRLLHKKDIDSRLSFDIIKKSCFICMFDCTGLDDLWRQACAIINPLHEPCRVALPASSEPWHVFVENDTASPVPLHRLKGPLVTVNSHSATLLAVPGI